MFITNAPLWREANSEYSEAFKCVGTHRADIYINQQRECPVIHILSALDEFGSSSVCQPKRKAFITCNLINTDLKIDYSFSRFTSII